jgi:hypothetical protein
LFRQKCVTIDDRTDEQRSTAWSAKAPINI